MQNLVGGERGLLDKYIYYILIIFFGIKMIKQKKTRFHLDLDQEADSKINKLSCVLGLKKIHVIRLAIFEFLKKNGL